RLRAQGEGRPGRRDAALRARSAARHAARVGQRGGARAAEHGYPRPRRAGSDGAGARDHPGSAQLGAPSACRSVPQRPRSAGVRPAPGATGDDTASRLKETWETNYSGRGNAKKVAVLGDGLKFEAMSMKNTDAQMIEQLKWTAEVVCSTYHVPPYKIGIGQQPTHNNIQSLNVEYYSQCLQVLIESIELCLDEGLGTGENLGTEFDLDGLLRMDAATQMDVLEKSKGKLTVNEQRKRLNQPPVTGGDTVYLQEQDHSLEWLARRDALPIEPPAATESGPDPDAERGLAADYLRKELGLAA